MSMLHFFYEAKGGKRRPLIDAYFKEQGVEPGTQRGEIVTCEGEVIGAFPDGRPIKRYDVPAPMQGATGEIEAFALYAGQSVGLVRDIQPIAAVMAELARAFR